MPEPTRDLPTLNVLQSYTAGRPDGRSALVLVTDQGPIAIELTATSIAAIRRELAQAELFLSQTAKMREHKGS